jgi:hypothetical protein
MFIVKVFLGLQAEVVSGRMPSNQSLAIGPDALNLSSPPLGEAWINAVNELEPIPFTTFCGGAGNEGVNKFSD